MTTKELSANEPAAWINENYLDDDDFVLDGKVDATLYGENDESIDRNYKLIPLYFHPADLTDWEIEEVHKKCEWASGYVYWKEFARAILRKASEK